VLLYCWYIAYSLLHCYNVAVIPEVTCYVNPLFGFADAVILLRLLHWLLVKQRITYKTAVLTHKVLTTSTPPYLHDRLTVATPARPMRSAGAPLLSVPRVRTEFARRAFSVAGPTVYNSLPADIRLCHSADSFKCHLKNILIERHSLYAAKRLCIQESCRRFINVFSFFS